MLVLSVRVTSMAIFAGFKNVILPTHNNQKIFVTSDI